MLFPYAVLSRLWTVSFMGVYVLLGLHRCYMIPLMNI